jgi:hypothetical protein
LAYWQGVAEQRTKTDPRGYVYEGTTTGIHPVRDKQTGRPIVDPAFAAAQQAGLVKAASDAASINEKNAQAAAARARAAATIAKSKAPPAPGKPTIQKINGIAYQWDQDSQTWKKAQGLPREHTPPKKPGSSSDSYGTGPRRVAPGKWATRTGKPLSPQASQIWERKWRNGEADGRGHVKPPKAGGGASGSGSSSGYPWAG